MEARMGGMVIYVCPLLFGLFVLTQGQTLSFSVTGGYVNKTDTARLVCSVGTALSDLLDILRNGVLAFNCPFGGDCTSQGLSSDYNVTQNDSAGIVTVIILNANQDRDGKTWTCKYGTLLSKDFTLSVISEASSRRLIEESGYIILELICTYPYSSLNITFYLGNDSYMEGILNYTVSNTTCTSSSEASVNYTLTFPIGHLKSYNGTFSVFVNNGFFTENISGARPYSFTAVTTTTTTLTTTTRTTATTTTTVTSSSTSMSSATSNVTIDNTSTKPTTTASSASATSFTSSNVTIGNITVNPTTNRSAASTTNSISMSMSPTAVSSANNTNNTSTSRNPTSGSPATNKTISNGSKSINSDIDIKVIVPAVVVPCGLLIIGVIILLVVLYVRRRAGKNVHESPDGMAVQDKGSNIDKWQRSLGHGKATDNLDAVYTTPDGFIIYPGPAAMSAARSYKDKKYHDVTDQYNRPYPGTYHHLAAYVPSRYTSVRAYTHKDKTHHGVTDQYSRPSSGTYGYQAAYVPSTYTSARTYPHKGKNYDNEGPISRQALHQMATSRPAYDQTAYYPQTGYYGQSGEDVYYSGGGQYWQRSRSHHEHNGRQQQREYYNQYEMKDYRGNKAGYRHTKKDTAFYY